MTTWGIILADLEGDGSQLLSRPEPLCLLSITTTTGHLGSAQRAARVAALITVPLLVPTLKEKMREGVNNSVFSGFTEKCFECFFLTDFAILVEF